MSDRYKHDSHRKYLLQIHLIFVVKYRKKILTGRIADDLKQYMYDSAGKHHLEIREMETDRDHIHMLISYSPATCVSDVVKWLKQETTFRLWQKHWRYLRYRFWKERTFWSDGYFVASIGEVSQETIVHYIQNQG